MTSPTFEPYRHSGKYGLHGPILALCAALVFGFPMGLVYAYAVKWIPFIYLNFIATAVYGCAFGIMGGLLMKHFQVRNSAVAACCGLLSGSFALFGAWNGHVLALFKSAPWFCAPSGIVAVMSKLFEVGSWSLKGEPVTGVPLAIVWIVEAGIIIGFSCLLTYGLVAATPFCEKCRCWMDEEKTITTLGAFTDPSQVALLKSGDLGPLARAIPRPASATSYGRLSLKYSPKCNDFFTVTLENVTQTTDRKGKTREQAELLIKDVMLPGTMLELITRFENFQSQPPQST